VLSGCAVLLGNINLSRGRSRAQFAWLHVGVGLSLGLDALQLRQLGLRSRLRMGLATGQLEFVECASGCGECAATNESADGARERASDGDGGTRPRGKSGHGSAASPYHQSRLRQLRSAARIGAPPRSPLENDDADFSSCRGRDVSVSSSHGSDNRLRHESNERRGCYGDDGCAAPVGRAAVAVASSLRQHTVQSHVASLRDTTLALNSQSFPRNRPLTRNRRRHRPKLRT
jgi:hypothetical protein